MRRVKCDEAKPYCLRCTSTGRRCDGYTVEALPQVQDTQESPDSLARALIFDTPWNALEARTFDYYRTKTSARYSGYINDPVWDHYVLQASHTEPTVRKAVNALAALHEQRSLNYVSGRDLLEVSQVKQTFLAMQYSQSLRGLQVLLNEGDIAMEAVLICIMLVAHFEVLQEHFVEALMHVESAIQLVENCHALVERVKIDSWILRSLVRMDIQASMLKSTRVPRLALTTLSFTDGHIPSSACSLSEGRDLVNHWSCKLLYFLRTVADGYDIQLRRRVAPEEALAQSRTLTSAFAALDTVLAGSRASAHANYSRRELIGLDILRVRVKLNRISAATCLNIEDCAHDAFLSDFRDALATCALLIEDNTEDARGFCGPLDEGLLEPLIFIAMSCRDGGVRRQALASLKALPTRQAVWYAIVSRFTCGNGLLTHTVLRGFRHVEVLVRLVEVCIAFEESECNTSVPECKGVAERRRVHSTGIDWWAAATSKGQLEATLRYRPNGLGGEWAAESVVIRT